MLQDQFPELQFQFEKRTWSDMLPPCTPLLTPAIAFTVAASPCGTLGAAKCSTQGMPATASQSTTTPFNI